MYDWKDDVMLLNNISQRMFFLNPLLVPVDRETLTLMEKSVLKTQQAALQGVIDVINHRLEQLDAAESSSRSARRVAVS